MKLEQQVTSLELSKRLKELGVKQESLFYWSENGNLITEEEYNNFVDWVDSVGKPDNYSVEQHYSAYTVAELGEILSSYQQGIMPSWNANFDHGWYFKGHGYTIHEKTEADARAKMLIYLLEHNLINIKE